ncbi:DUF3887 domain-containing protein [Nocardia panacis]|uniref:DUF3887 domain-containing protein n=1 Tax=Nocardia panacis TaxID=2340916 RepID=A0A3A4KTK7_9NOCA|nr:DUF3887 domain-containing protein [Nocardia panacis]RJO78375.1 DUF3887 domain-containing protein [Nocardia panacis]
MTPNAIGTRVAELARTRQFTDIEALFTPELRAAVSAETLAVAWSGEVAKIGEVREVRPAIVEPMGDLTRVSVPVSCERGALTIVVSVDHAGQLNGFRLAPPATSLWTPPRYVDPRAFVERDLDHLPATVTLPRRSGPRPGVVLLSSGPMDRDMTTGPNKPFKDLAQGLATRGAAVLRFDKTARACATMVEEYLPDTIAGIHALQEESGVDRVYVLGHSGGGKAAPRVAAAEPDVAGVIIMAADTVPLGRSAVRTARYLAARGVVDMVDSIAERAARLEDPELSAETTDLLFDWPGSYWLDLRDYDQVATAATLNRPILLLQGGRDYQVTVAEDLPLWRAELVGADVTIRVHDACDHLFFAGSGPSVPSDYLAPQHVDAAVVDDIATWLGLPERGLLAGIRARLARR